jgi:multidrug transporter EmrE-like cation transporter
MTDWYSLVWVCLAVFASALPIPLLKLYDSSKNISWLSLAVISNIVLIFIYIQFLKTTNIEIMYAFIKIASVILVVLGGILFFKLPVHAKTVVGILLGGVSLYLLTDRLSSE